jgi:hypothetical protein
MSQRTLAAVSGCAQAALSESLRGLIGWSVESLDRVCRALSTTPEELIVLGRDLLQNGEPTFPRPFKLAASEAPSDARLTVITRQAAGVTTTLAAFINAQSIADAMPEDYALYTAGELSDGEIFVRIRKRLALLSQECSFLASTDDLSATLLFGE